MLKKNDKISTVEPVFKGHARDHDSCPLNRGVPSMEVTCTKLCEQFFSVGTKICVPSMEMYQRRGSTGFGESGRFPFFHKRAINSRGAYLKGFRVDC